MPILVSLGLSVLDLGPMYATDRQTDVGRASSLNASVLYIFIRQKADRQSYAQTHTYTR